MHLSLVVKSSERARNSAAGSAAGITSPYNNPDAALTSLRREKGGLMLAYIINKHGRPLMPCHPAKARLLHIRNTADRFIKGF
jgi:predicted TIM-barrel enzyme